MIEGLFYFVIGLFFFAAFGHGLWLLGAAIVRSLGSSPQQPPASAKRHGCPVCLAPLHAGNHDCEECGWPHREPQPRAKRIIALRALQRLANRFRRDRWLDAETFARIEAALAPETKPVPLADAVTPAVAATVETPAVEPSSSMPSPAHVAPRDDATTDDVLGDDLLGDAPTREPQEYEVTPLAASVPAAVEPSAPPRTRLTPTPRPVEPPAKPWSLLLASFLEERNIRWGELIGGLLIIGSSIALVLSFWHAIAGQPLLKFGLFNGVTAALFAGGLYVERRWRLPTTGEGMLLIAVLLVPLNFLAIAAFTLESPPTDALTLIGEGATIALFAWLAFAAGRILVGSAAPLLAGGVVGCAAWELIVRRFAEPNLPSIPLFALASVPIALYVGPVMWGARKLDGVVEPHEADGNRLFKLLGTTLFAALLPLGLLLVKTESFTATAGRLAPLVGLLGGPLAAAGLVVRRRLTPPDLAKQRLVGTSLAVGGMGVMVAAVVLGWPLPAGLVPAAVVNVVILLWIAIRGGATIAHLPAALCATAAYIIGFHILAGHLAWSNRDSATTLAALLGGSGGAALVAPVLVCGAVAAWRRRSDKQLASRWDAPSFWYAVAAGLVMTVSLALVSWRGFARPGDPSAATWVYAVYAAVLFGAAATTGRSLLGYAGSFLLLASLSQGLVFRYGSWLSGVNHWPIALLAHAATALLIGLIVQRRRRDWVDSLTEPWIESAIVTSCLAVPFLIREAAIGATMPAALGCTVLTALWGVLAQHTRSAWWFAFCQTAGFAAITLWSHLVVRRQSWYSTTTEYPRLLDPRAIQTYAVACTALCGMWTIWRVGRRRFTPDRNDEPRHFKAAYTVDRAVLAGLVIVAVGLSAYAAVPGICRELSPRNLPTTDERRVPPGEFFEWLNIPHAPAADWGTWLLLAAVAGVIALGLWERFLERRPAALIALGSAAALLVAARWDADVAAASALRWSSAGAFFVGSWPLWFRGRLAPWIARLDWPGWTMRRPGLARRMFNWLLSCSLAPPVAMIVGLGISGVARYAIPGELASLLFAFGITAAVAFLIAGALKAATERLDRLAGRAWTSLGTALVLLLGAAPFVATLIFLVATALKASPVLGPDPTSFFVRSGLAVSYAVPMLLVAATLVGHAVVNRSAATAFAASLTLNLGATAGYLLAIAQGGLRFDASLWTRLAQLNAVVAGMFALAWIGAMAMRRRSSPAEPGVSSWLTLQAALAAALAIPAIAVGTLILWFNPLQPAGIPATAADPAAWGMLLLVALSTAYYFRAANAMPPVFAWTGLGIAVAADVALFVVRYETGNLLAFRALTGGWAIVACGLAALGIVGERRGGRWFAPPVIVALWSSVVGTVVVATAGRGALIDLFRSAAPAAFFLAVVVLMSALAARLAIWIASRWRLYVSALLWQVAAAWAWLDFIGDWFYGGSAVAHETLGRASLIALAAVTPLWLWLELRYVMPRIGSRPAFRLPPLHRTTAILSSVSLVLLAVSGLARDAAGHPAEAQPWLIGTLILATLIAVGSTLWDVGAHWGVALFYLTGLTAVAAALDQFNLDRRTLAVTGVVFLAAYGLATSYLWSRRRGLAEWCDRLQMPRRFEANDATHESGAPWLVTANYILALTIACLAFWIVLTFEYLAPRLAAAKTIVAQAVAVGLLARGERRSMLQRHALELSVLWGIALGWAFMDPGLSNGALHRAIAAVAALAAAIAIYGLGFSKLLRRENEWTRAAEQLVPWLIGVGALLVVAVLGRETLQTYRFGKVDLTWEAIATMIAALGGLVVAALTAALVPGRDPLGLSERGRTAYVYAAEALLALMALHVRITMPWLFHGFFSRYWPLLAMLVAFVGVGLGEVFRRRRQTILSEPLERTGALLPLLPVLGFWLLPTENVHYSLLLLAVGVLYATLAVMRKSFGFGILATLAANGGLWYFLNDLAGYGWLQHPQLWLIPPALCVLVAAQWNRRQLTDEQTTSIRYAASSMIYVSSTADVFLNGTAEAPWLPLVLGGLSLVGVFAGIALRTRAFLLLGTAFLTLALMTIIWHAGYDLDQTWIFYVTGIVVGVLIIALFALFEKKREEMLRLVEHLREWEN